MKLPNKKYYFLEEVAEIIKCKVTDIIHYGAIGELKISAEIDVPYRKKMIAGMSSAVSPGYKGFYQISQKDIHVMEMDRNADELMVNSFYPDMDELEAWNGKFCIPFNTDAWQGNLYFKDGIPISVKCENLFVMGSDLQLFMKEHFEPEVEVNEEEPVIQNVEPSSDRLLFQAQSKTSDLIEIEISIAECAHPAQELPVDRESHIATYLEQHKDKPFKERVRWLRENTRMSNADIGDRLDIGTNDPKSRGSRKQKVQEIYRSNFDDETWGKMHPEKKMRK